MKLQAYSSRVWALLWRFSRS